MAISQLARGRLRLATNSWSRRRFSEPAPNCPVAQTCRKSRLNPAACFCVPALAGCRMAWAGCGEVRSHELAFACCRLRFRVVPFTSTVIALLLLFHNSQSLSTFLQNVSRASARCSLHSLTLISLAPSRSFVFLSSECINSTLFFPSPNRTPPAPQAPSQLSFVFNSRPRNFLAYSGAHVGSWSPVF